MTILNKIPKLKLYCYNIRVESRFRFSSIFTYFQAIRNAPVEPLTMAIKKGETKESASEKFGETSSDKKKIAPKVWISRQLVTHWFLNTVCLIYSKCEIEFNTYYIIAFNSSVHVIMTIYSYVSQRISRIKRHWIGLLSPQLTLVQHHLKKKSNPMRRKRMTSKVKRKRMTSKVMSKLH